MPPQISAGSVTDAEFLDQRGIMQSTVLQVARGFRMAVELKLIKSGCPLQQLRTGTTRLPVVALQIVQQRDTLFEPLQILGHGAVFASRVEIRWKAAVFPGKDGGRRRFLKPQGPEPGEKRE